MLAALHSIPPLEKKQDLLQHSQVEVFQSTHLGDQPVKASGQSNVHESSV